ncbi:hypothetical protein D9M73_175310 [compost metagenome]
MVNNRTVLLDNEMRAPSGIIADRTVRSARRGCKGALEEVVEIIRHDDWHVEGECGQFLEVGMRSHDRVRIGDAFIECVTKKLAPFGSDHAVAVVDQGGWKGRAGLHKLPEPRLENLRLHRRGLATEVRSFGSRARFDLACYSSDQLIPTWQLRRLTDASTKRQSKALPL